MENNKVLVEKRIMNTDLTKLLISVSYFIKSIGYIPFDCGYGYDPIRNIVISESDIWHIADIYYLAKKENK